MDLVTSIGGALLKKFLLPILQALWRPISRFVVCPLKKSLFPVVDARSGIKQSRMRYYRIRFSFNGEVVMGYQEVDSMGNLLRRTSSSGRTYFPPKVCESAIVADGQFQHPKWRRIDWRNIFDGDAKSGVWGIENAAV